MNFASSSKYNKIKFFDTNQFFLIFSSIFLLIIFLFITNLINKKNLEDKTNLKYVTESNEFEKFSDYLLSNITSPYKEIKYTIKNNDSVEKILKKFKIRSIDINEVSIQLKKRKLSNIYSGRALKLITKKKMMSQTFSKSYFISNTSSVEIRKKKKQ